MSVQVWKNAAGVWTCPGRAPSGQPVSTARGALALGTASYTPPGGSLYVDPVNGLDANPGTLASPKQTVGNARLSVPANGTVVCRAGTYHESFSTTSGNNAFTVQNYPLETVWFDGSVVVTTWTQSGATWVHTGVPTQFSRANSGNGSLPASYNSGDVNAAKADQVFVDGSRLLQIADAATPASGQFSVNYAANTITIGTNPSGHEVRVSDLRSLCVASSVVSWKGVGIRRYASDNTFAVTSPLYYGGTSAGSVFENCHIRDNAMAALNLNKHSMTVNKCTVQGNMYTGIGGTQCDGLTITGCDVSGNNVGLFKTSPATGGIKITSCYGALVDDNQLNGNNGANGIWFDSSCIQITITNNAVTGNHRVGIQEEETDGGYVAGVQGRCVCAGNIVSGAQYGLQYLVSGNMDVFNNSFTNCSTMYVIIQTDRVGNVANFYLSQTVCPWDTVNVALVNNVFGPSSTAPTVKVRYIDSYTAGGRSADAMNGTLKTNAYLDSVETSMVQWGIASGTPYYTNYSTIAAAQSAHPANISGNVFGSLPVATPMPANVAAALGVPTGTLKVGPYITS